MLATYVGEICRRGVSGGKGGQLGGGLFGVGWVRYARDGDWGGRVVAPWLGVGWFGEER